MRSKTFHSPRAELLVAPPEVFLGRRVGEVLPPEAAAIAMAALREASVHGHASGQQIVLALPQSQKWFELPIARREAARGYAGRFMVLSRYITERKHSEQTLCDGEARYRELFDSNRNRCGCISWTRWLSWPSTTPR